MKTISVRFSDVDMQNHANHTAIVEWVAHARVSLLDKIMKDSNIEDIDHVLVNLSINFSDEVIYPGNVEITENIVKIGSKSITTEFDVHQQGRLCASAKCINVFFKPSTKETIEIPKELKEKYEKEIFTIA